MDYYKLAGINFAADGLSYRYFKRRLKDYVSVPEPESVIIRYRENENIETPQGNIVGRLSYREFLETPDKYINYDFTPDKRNVALMESDKSFTGFSLSLADIEQRGGAATDVRAFNMMGELLKYVILMHEGIILHSSALAYKGEGVVFSAKSGTGKSTHTRLWTKVFKDDAVILNDDMPALRFENGKPFLFGTPWSGKTEINRNMKVPLKAIVFLERGEKNSVERAQPREAVFRLLNETPIPVYKELASLTIDIIGKFMEAVPTYILKCNMEDEAAYTANREIFGKGI